VIYLNAIVLNNASLLPELQVLLTNLSTKIEEFLSSDKAFSILTAAYHKKARTMESDGIRLCCLSSTVGKTTSSESYSGKEIKIFFNFCVHQHEKNNVFFF